MKPNRLRILIADDHQLIRDGVRRQLRRRHNYVVVAEASNGAQAAKQAEILQPDIAILDMSMPWREPRPFELGEHRVLRTRSQIGTPCRVTLWRRRNSSSLNLRDDRMIRSTFHPVLKPITLNKERRYDLRQPVCPARRPDCSHRMPHHRRGQ